MAKGSSVLGKNTTKQVQNLRRGGQLGLFEKIVAINWFIVLMICIISGIGIALLYSVAGGSMDPWAKKQLIRFLIGLGAMFFIALINIRVWMYFAYPIYFITLVMLVVVDVIGHKGMGSTRWLDIGFMRLQPSEIMKIALILVLCRYFHCLELGGEKKLKSLIWPVLLIALPLFLVLRQPDLGTSLLIAFGGIAIIFAAGVRIWIFIVGILSAIPIAIFKWNTLPSYQRGRVETFLNPERDPLGAGYQIVQSKIAFGSGGVSGKGFMQGTQSQLNFLPEKQTDFIFTVLAEEFGLVGSVGLLGLYLTIIGYAIFVSFTIVNKFGRLLILGMGITFFLYIFINMGMVMGMLPVVGVPLPLVSWGGSAMLTLMIGMGLIFSVAIHRQQKIPRGGAFA
jgi:rod shape determining protein RodA